MPSSIVRSGIEFAGADVRAMQSDDLANPGFLWVERGEKLWRDAASGASCESCHADASASMRGVAARYPAFDAASGTWPKSRDVSGAASITDATPEHMSMRRFIESPVRNCCVPAYDKWFVAIAR